MKEDSEKARDSRKITILTVNPTRDQAGWRVLTVKPVRDQAGLASAMTKYTIPSTERIATTVHIATLRAFARKFGLL